jgi:hypothetical protein
MLRYKTPGVIIEEVPTTGPIAGVGTSTAAFLGSALSGPINQPVKITNWTQFTRQFGGYIVSPRRYLAHAVRGFFDNGGTVCYVVRVGTAAKAFLDLLDEGGGKTIRVTALADGKIGDAIKVTVTSTNRIVNEAKVVKNTSPAVTIVSASATVVTLTNAADSAKFQPGDFITIADNPNEHAQVLRARGNQLALATPLVGTSYQSGDAVRIADLRPGQTQFRVAAGAGIEAGSVLVIKNGTTNEDRVVDVAFRFNDGSVQVTLAKGLTNGYSLKASDPDVKVSSYEFDLAVTDGVLNESFPTLSMDPRHSRYFVRAVASSLVTATLPVAPDTPSTQTPPKNRPAVLSATALANGADDDLANTGISHYEAGLGALEAIDDVNMVLCPDRTDAQGVQARVRDHCERMADRFAILDSAFGVPPDITPGTALANQRGFVESARGYAALYYPWLAILDPNSRTGEDTLMVPPSGHLAGIYARTDEVRGVHKAPANEYIAGTIGLSQVVDGVMLGELNDAGVNVLRIFAGQARPVVWGARTVCPASETPWRYVSVRRLFLFVEESIQEGIRWAVFEPNDLSLWKKLSHTITEFLTRVWRSGALFGATAAEAFYVKIDEENNPPATRALGQVIIEIGLAPVRPAEFVVVRIGMWEGGSNVAEQ